MLEGFSTISAYIVSHPDLLERVPKLPVLAAQGRGQIGLQHMGVMVSYTILAVNRLALQNVPDFGISPI